MMNGSGGIATREAIEWTPIVGTELVPPGLDLEGSLSYLDKVLSVSGPEAGGRSYV